MNKKSEISSKIDLFRSSMASRGLVRADVYLSEALKQRIKSIAQDNGWNYLETVAALTELGTEVFEVANNSAKVLPSEVIQASQASVLDMYCSAVPQGAIQEAQTLTKAVSYLDPSQTKSSLTSFIESRKGDPK